MENPYAYVKNLQDGFDLSKLHFSDAYYETVGLPLPNGRNAKKPELLWETTVTFTIQRKTPD